MHKALSTMCMCSGEKIMYKAYENTLHEHSCCFGTAEMMHIIQEWCDDTLYITKSPTIPTPSQKSATLLELKDG